MTKSMPVALADDGFTIRRMRSHKPRPAIDRFVRGAFMAALVLLTLSACLGGGEQSSGAGGALVSINTRDAPGTNGNDASSGSTPPTGLPPVAVTAVKWYPGHYLYVNWDASDGEIAAVLAANPRLRGIMMLFSWRELEPSFDFYDFNRIQLALDRAERLGTRLAIYVEAQAYLPNENRMPDYIDGPIYGGGRYWLPNDAVNPVLWNATVAARLAALYRELGARFDAHPRLAVVTTTETALALSGYPVPDYVEPYTFEKHEAAMRETIAALRDGFKRTVTIQNVNYPEQIVDGVVEMLRDRSVGLGGPDVFLEDPALENGVYRYYWSLAGTLPIGPSVQWDDYTWKFYGGPDSDHTVTDLYQFARGRLRANFLFWEARYFPRDYVAAIAQMMNLSSFPADAAGGLETACPTTFQACTSD